MNTYIHTYIPCNLPLLRRCGMTAANGAHSRAAARNPSFPSRAHSQVCSLCQSDAIPASRGRCVMLPVRQAGPPERQEARSEVPPVLSQRRAARNRTFQNIEAQYRYISIRSCARREGGESLSGTLPRPRREPARERGLPRGEECPGCLRHSCGCYR